ncbi:hypothetical protein ACQ86O_21875 [Serratia sp. L9]|uniref:hypothetical protein n=1 Tax=Serratia sp. L9 TaxID=3423946 RepID=UPI003D67187F
MEVSLSDLKNELKNKNATSFRFYNESEKSNYWTASFGFSTSDFGGFYHFDAQCALSKRGKEKFIEFIKELSSKNNFSYGIVYNPDNVADGFYYAEGGNFVQIYQCENPMFFEKETGGIYEGQERYKNTMLRMVYPVNVINRHHLDIVIENVSLKEWISSNEKHGSLEGLNNNLWLWTVEDTELDEVNRYLGEAGVLISWKPLATKKTARKLP